MIISFLTDYGLTDAFVGICHGVIARICPSARVIDLSHGVPPGEVRVGAVTLLDAVPYVRAGIHLTVVDPGVGTRRRPLILRAADGTLFVGPDNGVLRPAAEACGGIAEAYDVSLLRGEELRFRTFDGRDVFAPAAAMLACGIAAEELGDAVAVGELVDLRLPRFRWVGDTLICEVLLVDRYGNLSLSARTDDLAGWTAVRVAGRRVRVVATYAEIEAGEVGLLGDSAGRLSLAADSGSAASALGLRAGDEVRLEP